MKNLLLGTITGLLFTLILWSLPPVAKAQTTPTPQTTPTFSRGTVTTIVTQEEREVGGYQEYIQVVQVKLSTDETVEAAYQLPLGASTDRLLQAGQQVIVAEVTDGNDGTTFLVTDFYRFPAVLIVIGIFLVVVVILSGWRGVTGLIGLAISIGLLLFYLVPQLAAGADPLLISSVVTVVIAVVSIGVAHGRNQRTAIALVSTLLTLGLAAVAALSFVSITQLFGLGSEEGLELQYGAAGLFNLKGLLLAGMLIGALGVLDDITTAQAAAIEELHRANPKLNRGELYQRGMSIGREHITALINTLALAYAGVSLPMLLVFRMYQQPLWVTLNSEFVVEEVVRTVVGSLALTLAVPITTWLTSWVLTRKPRFSSTF